VYAQALLEDRRGEEPSACARLLEVMAATPSDEHVVDTDTLVSVLVDDTRFAGSIRRSLGSAWENARGAREAISSEMWESINTTYRLADARRGGASAFARQSYLDWVRDRAATLAGLTDSTMSRDDSWRFIVLGRSLERVDVTARLLSTRLGDAWGSSGWTTMLRACSAQEAYVRSYRTGVDGRGALEFMLLDRHFPRSVFRALSEAEGILFELDPGSERVDARSEARRVVGRACAELEFVHIDELEAGLPDQLIRLEGAVLAAHDAIAARFFHATAAIAWVQG
jgi:uncharacterized alpha-E superfamily protein